MAAGRGLKSENRIVVGVDGSEPSKSALRWAQRFSKVTGARIDAVTAWQIPVTFGWALMGGGWKPEEEAEKILADAVESVFGADRPEGMRMITDEGNPAKVLLDRAAVARLLVVGSRGHGGFAGLMLGSVSANCAEHARCPVLVVRGTEPDASEVDISAEQQ